MNYELKRGNYGPKVLGKESKKFTGFRDNKRRKNRRLEGVALLHGPDPAKTKSVIVSQRPSRTLLCEIFILENLREHLRDTDLFRDDNFENKNKV